MRLSVRRYNLVRMRRAARIMIVLILSFTAAQCLAQVKPEEVVFKSDGRQLHGFLWKPEGSGPFRAVLWNDGSEKLPGSEPALATFYTSHSYVFFVPHRRGQGRSPGEYIQDEIAKAAPRDRARTMVELQQEALD